MWKFQEKLGKLRKVRQNFSQKLFGQNSGLKIKNADKVDSISGLEFRES